MGKLNGPTRKEQARELGVHEETARLDERKVFAKLEECLAPMNEPERVAALEHLAAHLEMRALRARLIALQTISRRKGRVSSGGDPRVISARPHARERAPRSPATQTPSQREQAGHRGARFFEETNMRMNPNLICRLNAVLAERNVAPEDIRRLRGHGEADDHVRFAAELERVAGSSPEHTEQPDAMAVHESNPNLGRYMRAIGLTAAQVREHGPRGALESGHRIVPNLQELADNTAARGDRMGTGR